MHFPQISLSTGLRNSRVSSDVTALAALYFFSSAAAFLWIYIPSKMTSLGWTGAPIGAFFMIKTISQAVATPIWAQFAGRTHNGGGRLLGLQHWIALGAIAFLPLASFWTLGMVIAVILGITVRSSAPLMDTMTLDTLGMGRFGRIRSIGTIGFGLLALLFALAGSRIDHQQLSELAPWTMLLLTARCLPAIKKLPRPPSPLRRIIAPRVHHPGSVR